MHEKPPSAKVEEPVTKKALWRSTVWMTVSPPTDGRSSSRQPA